LKSLKKYKKRRPWKSVLSNPIFSLKVLEVVYRILEQAPQKLLLAS